jgi:hypothetical protein
MEAISYDNNSIPNKMKNLLTYEAFLLENQLNEIGDASLPSYDWKTIDKTSHMEVSKFDVDGVDYTVWMGSFKNGVNLTFDANGDDKITTNMNKQYRIMSTVIEIMKDYLERNLTVTKISFVPNEDFKDDNRRLNLYMAYLVKHLDVIDTKIENLQNNKVIELTIKR